MLQRSVNHVLIETGAQHLVKSMRNEPRSRSCLYPSGKELRLCFAIARKDNGLLQLRQHSSLVGLLLGLT